MTHLLRSGWKRKGVLYPESVASHAYAVAVLCMLHAKKAGVDECKSMQLALIHDLPESKTGDITPHDNIMPEDKAKKEIEAMKIITKDTHLLDLFNEFQEQKNLEAQFVFDMYKI